MKQKIFLLILLFNIQNLNADFILKQKINKSISDSFSLSELIPNGVTKIQYDYIVSQINKPQWTLCFDTEVSGYSASTFHSNCDNKGATVTILKLNNEVVLGAYNGYDWSVYGGYTTISTTNAKIFKLKDNDFKTATATAYPQNSTYQNSNYGPTFGGGHDLVLLQSGNTNGYCNPHSYGSPYDNSWCGGSGGTGIFVFPTNSFQFKVFQVN